MNTFKWIRVSSIIYFLFLPGYLRPCWKCMTQMTLRSCLWINVMDVGEGQHRLSRWSQFKVVMTEITTSTICLSSSRIPKVWSPSASSLCRQCSCNGPPSRCFAIDARNLSQRPYSIPSPNLIVTDNFKARQRCFRMLFHFGATPMAPVPAGVLCIQWCLTAENAGRSNQSCFTSLDLFPQLRCKLAAANRLLLYIGLLVK